jgi:hypothetical protein
MHLINRYFLWLRRGLYFSVIMALALGGGIFQPVSAQTVSPNIPGIAYTGSTGINETTSQIMAREREDEKKPHSGTRVSTDNGPDFSAKPNNPNSAGLVQGPGNGVLPVLANASAPQAIGLSFEGPSSPTPCATPPDTMGAVGPTQFIVTLNCNFVSYNKVTGAVDGFLNASPNAFFTSVRGGISTSDPHVRYDRTSGRWFIVMINVGFPNIVLLAVSSGSSITGASSWSFFSFPITIVPNRTNCLGDYPTPGIDANAIYIGLNMFCGASLNSATYLTSDAFVVQKSSVLGAGPIKVTAFPNLYNNVTKVGPFTPQGVDNPDPAAAEGYIIGVDGGSWGLLQLRRVSNPGADPASANPPTISGNVSITTPLQSAPFTQPHLGNTGGTTGQIDGSDGRLLGAYIRDGSLWTSLDSASNSTCASATGNDRNAVFWYEITGIPTGSTPSLHQNGSVCDTSTTASPTYYSYGTIMVNGQGHAVVGFTIAGAANYTTPGFTGRLKADPLSTTQGIVAVVPGLHPYNPSFDSGASGFRRWGDFSYVSLDPCDDMTLWSIQEYASADNTYGERIAQLKAPPPAAPANATSVFAGLSSVNVTVTGTSSSGSGFYDTPATFIEPCRTRLTASVSGGVTVNSVTFTDPTHVTLNVSTVGATVGTKNVTISNPDGQSLTGAGILNVTGGSLVGTTTSLSSNVNPSVFGQSVTITATVAPVSGVVTPGGTVTFSIDSVPLAPVTLNSSGQASLSTSTLAVGPHSVSASYTGDSNFSASSGALSGGQTVNRADTTLKIVLPVNPTTYNQSASLTIAVTASAPGSGTPSGTVAISIDGSVPVTRTLNSGGVYTFVTSPLTVGTHTVSVVYNGDASFNGSSGSLAGGLVVGKAATQIVLISSLNPALIGQPVIFTASVTSSTGLVIDGQVTITINSVPFTTALPALDQVSQAAGPLPQGENSISASYAGSSNFSASSSSVLMQRVDANVFFPVLFK